MIGLAFGTALHSSDLAKAEMNMFWKPFTDINVARGHVSLTPDLQFVINPSGQYGTHNIFVGGVRAQIDI
jgi:carbohydrate-selective porin OprB